MNNANTLFNFSIAYTWEITASHASVKLLYDGISNFGFAGLGGMYFFSDTDFSPVAEASLGYGAASASNTNLSYTPSSVSGFVGSLGGGVQFFRTSTINLEISAHYNLLLNKNELGNPSFTSLRLGLYF
jgi:hypothetical protein